MAAMLHFSSGKNAFHFHLQDQGQPDLVDFIRTMTHENKYRYLVLKIDDQHWEIQATTTAPYDTPNPFHHMLTHFPKDEPRYAIFKFDDQAPQPLKSQIMFILWAPEEAKIKTRMIYTSSKGEVKTILVGCKLEIQATNMEELQEDKILEKLEKRIGS